MKRIIFTVLGFVCLGFGCVGIFLPVLPTVPFFLATLFCFTQASETLRAWFIGTKLYQNHLDSYVKKEGMRMDTKIRIILSITMIMGISISVMLWHGVYIPCIILGIVWVIHLIYFIFGVKTINGTRKTGGK